MPMVLPNGDYNWVGNTDTAASDCITWGVVSWHNNEQIIHHVAKFSKQHILAEYNYNIYDK